MTPPRLAGERLSPVGCIAIGVQPHVFVEVTGVPERARAHAAGQRLVAGVGADVDLEAVLARVQFPAVEADVAFAGAAHAGDEGLDLGTDAGLVGVQRRRRWRAGGRPRRRRGPAQPPRAAAQRQVQLQRVGLLEQLSTPVAPVPTPA